jgi:predicted flavoprotein YhiN
MQSQDVIVIGAGASGMMAAGRAAECGANVTLLEKTDGPGKKMLISGKTRCNLSNSADMDEFIGMYGPNGRFLYSAFHRFFREDLLEFLRRYGVETRVERSGRIFPVSDDAHDVVGAFDRYLAGHNVKIKTVVKVNQIMVEQYRVNGVDTDKGTFKCNAVILATGGSSWPSTGSSGDGYSMAAVLGHTIVPLRPALVPLVVQEIETAGRMMGESLHSVRLTAWQCSAAEIDPALTPARDCGRGIAGKKPRGTVIESRNGDMMMTHFGIGGPVTLQMSLAVADALQNGPVSISIDLQPALSCDRLRARLQKNFDLYSKRTLFNILKELLPLKMVGPLVDMSGIPGDRLGSLIVGEERDRLAGLIKAVRFNIKEPLPLSMAMVTAGGVSLKEIDPRDMASRLIKGLYFCGEVMDIDADTGGFNLQAAFSTGYVAGESAAAPDA